MSASRIDNDENVCFTDYVYLFSPDLLKGKVAFITGGGSGICFTIAEILMRHGCHTVIASRNLERLQLSAKKLTKATGVQCYPVQMDVRKPSEVEASVNNAIQYFGKIDILINGSAGNFAVPVNKMSYNAFQTVIAIDTLGTFNTSKAVYHAWFKDHGGVIVNITTNYVRPPLLQAHASSAKAAIDALTCQLAAEWGRQGIRVNSIGPGVIISTEGWNKLGGQIDGAEQMISQQVPLQRVGKKLDCAHAVLYLVSDAASYITGAKLMVDGGHWITGSNGYERLDMYNAFAGSKL